MNTIQIQLIAIPCHASKKRRMDANDSIITFTLVFWKAVVQCHRGIVVLSLPFTSTIESIVNWKDKTNYILQCGELYHRHRVIRTTK